jgi:hypothetical protein
MVQFRHCFPEDTQHEDPAATLCSAASMMNRRLAIVAGLGVVEVWIVGLMIHSFDGDRPAAGFGPAVANPAAATSAGDTRTARTLETGPAPHVVIDDDGATLGVTVRPGTTVDVSEQTQVSGWVQGARRPVTIERTGDGVRIVRSEPGLIVSMGLIHRRLDVIVPPQTRLDVENSGSMTIAGLRAALSLHSDDGSISVSDVRGSVRVKTDDGRIQLADVAGPSIDLDSDNGRISCDRVDADGVTIASDDGRIDVWRSVLHGGKIQTSNGRIGLTLDPRSDVTVSAHTSSGKVVAESPLMVSRSNDDDSDAPATIRVGGGAGRLEVGSDDGSITVGSGGVSL